MKNLKQWSVVGLVVASTAAHGDTYNFFFAKPKGKKGPDSAEPAKAAPAAVAPAPAASSTTAGPAPAPVVINNTNSFPNASAPTPTPVVSTPEPSPQASASLTATAQTSSRPWFRLGMGTLWVPNAMLYSNQDSRERWGGILSLGVDFTPSIGVNAFGGIVSGSSANWYAGVDLELTPFRIDMGSWDLFTLGFLVGGSTARAAYGNIGSLHAGARATVNFGKSFGVTVAARGNLGYVIAEGGIVTRF